MQESIRIADSDRNRVPGFLTALVLTGVTVLLAACGAAPPVEVPKPKDVQLKIVAAADVNPNPQGRPSPVYLHLYQLRDSARFLAAEFDDVAAKADTALAAVIVGREGLMLQPGATVSVKLKIEPESRLLGVVAEYSDLPGTRWRLASTAPPGGLVELFEDAAPVLRVNRDGLVLGPDATAGQ